MLDNNLAGVYLRGDECLKCSSNVSQDSRGSNLSTVALGTCVTRPFVCETQPMFVHIFFTLLLSLDCRIASCVVETDYVLL